MISIIIPVFNTASYLKDCIDSVIGQTFQDWECILIDDGSTDGSRQICDEYASIDRRIRVIHQQNKGLVNVRNTGLREARGEFIAWVDSDDSVHPLWLETLYEIMSTNDCDISMVGVLAYHDNLFPTDYVAKKYVAKKQEACKIPTCQLVYQLYNNQINAFVWNKLYRRIFIGNTTFKVKGAEDRYFNLMLFLKGASLFKTDMPLYFYRIRKGSITNGYDTTWTANNLISRCKIYSNYLEADNKLKYKVTLLTDLYERLLSVNSNQIQYKHCSPELIKNTSRYIFDRTYHDFITCDNIQKKLKLKVYILYNFPLLYSVLIKSINYTRKILH